MKGSLLVIFATAALLIRVPASLFAGWVEGACGGVCRLAEAQGSPWSGRAFLYLRPREGAPWQPMGLVRWEVDAGSLGGRISGLGGQAAMATGRKGLSLSASRLHLPASLVLPALPGLPRAGWGGELEAAELRATWFWQGGWHGEGSLAWREAQTSVLPDRVLGDYRLLFQRETDGSARFQLSTEKGVLALAGQGNLPVGGSWNLNLEAEPTQRERQAMEPLLRGMGQAEAGGGRYRIVWQGT